MDPAVAWGGGFPLKRSTFSDREATGNGRQNGVQCEYAAREAARLNFRSKSAHSRSFKGERHDGRFCKSNFEFYKIAIIVIATYFLGITLMQGSVMLIVSHTDFLPIPGYEVSEYYPSHRIGPGTEALSDCERAMKDAVQNFTEHLEARTNLSEPWRLGHSSRRSPRLALICPDLEDFASALYLSTIARGLQWLGYGLEVYARHEGQLRTVWEEIQVPVYLVEEGWQNITVDWLNFEGVVAISIGAKKVLESLAQEPFTEIPILWIINDGMVVERDIDWASSEELQTVYRSWLRTFNRSSVLVFPNFFLPTAYADFYNERFYVIPGSPWDVWTAEQYMITNRREDIRAGAGLSPDDHVIVVVGCPCANKEPWREHAIVMKAVANLTTQSRIEENNKLRHLCLYILGQGKSSDDYQNALQMIAQHTGLRHGIVKHVGVDEDVLGLLWMADSVVYASIWEELSFPPILVQAMSLKRPVVVPDITAISQHVVDRRSGFLFTAGDDQALAQVLSMVLSIPALADAVAVEGAILARNLLAKEAVLEFGYLLEKLLDFHEDVQLPRRTVEIQEGLPQGWRWDIFGEADRTVVSNSTAKDLLYLTSAADLRFMGNGSIWDDLELSTDDLDLLDRSDWTLEKMSREATMREQVEEDMMKDRIATERSTYEDVRKMVKKTETRVSQGRHVEIDHFEVERVAQPLCIYEIYQGPGAWSFLHKNHIHYRGLSLTTDGRRPYLDDVDGAKRLGLLNNSYYRDVLCDVGGLFAIAKLIDRVHWNAWIGFQPWRAASKKISLTPSRETALLAAVSGENDGDALYFWAQLDSKESKVVDFWSICDAANAGNCRTIFVEAFKEMYGLPSTWTELPPMPMDGGAWAAMHCWAMPTTSFLEFVMFLRMFVSALDAIQYDDHHNKGKCCFKNSTVEAKHCYCNFLESLVNIWAYHSARRMIYLDLETGLMTEQHNVDQRKGNMWVKFFDRRLLESMDEDLAEEADDEEGSDRRWLWPETGEVFWNGTREKERRERFYAKVEKKRQQMERQARQSKYRQQALGRM